MKEADVKSVLFRAFLEWMRGQTVGVDPVDGSEIYYPWDVDNYVKQCPRFGQGVTD